MTFDCIKLLEKLRTSNTRHTGFVVPDGNVVSFPRSGRSWLMFMTKYIAYVIAADTKIGLVLFKHDGTNINRANPRTHWLRDKSCYKNKDICLVIRFPLDTIVSGWHLNTKRLYSKFAKGMSISRYLRDDDHGLPICIDFMNGWARQRDIPRKFMIVRYEDMFEDPRLWLEKVIEFFDQRSAVSDALIDEAVQLCSFDSLRRHDNECLKNIVYVKRVKRQTARSPSVRDDFMKSLEACAVRRGGTYQFWRDLSSEDIEWGLEYIEQNLDPFYSYYKRESGCPAWQIA